MTNKYQERCYLCSEWIQPQKGVFEDENSSFKVRHSSCFKPQLEKERKNFFPENEFLYIEILKNKAYFCSTASKRLWNALTSHYLKLGGQDVLFEDSSEVFEVSIDILRNRYLEKQIYNNITEVKRVMCGICRVQVRRFIERKIDQLWWGRLSPSDKKKGLRPPSYWYHRNYQIKHTERLKELKRGYYANNPKYKKSALRRNKLRMERIRKNPILLAEFNKKQAQYARNRKSTGKSLQSS